MIHTIHVYEKLTAYGWIGPDTWTTYEGLIARLGNTVFMRHDKAPWSKVPLVVDQSVQSPFTSDDKTLDRLARAVAENMGNGFSEDGCPPATAFAARLFYEPAAFKVLLVFGFTWQVMPAFGSGGVMQLRKG